MPLRKERAPQGISNRSQKFLFGKLSDTLSTNVQLLKPSQSLQSYNNSLNLRQKEPFSNTIPNYQSQFNLLRKVHVNNIQKIDIDSLKKQGKKSSSQNQILNQNISSAQKAILKLRAIYKYKTNIKKIVKAWGFQNKAYLNQEQFINVMSNHFQIKLNKAQTAQIFKKVSKDQDQLQGSQLKLDMPSFIGLIYNSIPFPNPMIDITSKVDVSTQHAPLIKKIKNLNQLNRYAADSEDVINNKPTTLPTITKKVQRQQSKSVIHEQSFNKSTISTLGQPSLYQTMYNSSSPKYSYSTTKQHSKFFTPLQYLQINQQKTRFSATPLLKLNDQSLKENKRQKIMDQKLKIIDEMKSLKQFQKQRYENKLLKIRQNKEKQNIMIDQIDRKKQMILNANMKKTREQNMAYQYINFVKNDWK